VRRTQPRQSPWVTAGEGRAILGTGPGTASRARGRKVEARGARSETPRPSSRDTAKPPRWVSGRGGDCRDQPSVRRGSPLTLRAERTEAGPGREQTCRQNRSDAGSGPRGEVATHFVGLLVFTRRGGRTLLDEPDERARGRTRRPPSVFASRMLRFRAHRRAAVAAEKSADFRIFSSGFQRKSRGRVPRASIRAHGRAAPP